MQSQFAHKYADVRGICCMVLKFMVSPVVLAFDKYVKLCGLITHLYCY